MFEQCARESKLPPDFKGTDDYQVFLTLNGKVQDPQFLKFLEKIGRERQISFDSTDFIILDCINREKNLPKWANQRIPALIERGVIERVGRKLILSRNFYEFAGRKGVYTRKRGLDKETNKQLLLRHIRNNSKMGSNLQELMQVLPSLTRNQIQKLLLELKKENRIYVEGKTKGAKWFLKK